NQTLQFHSTKSGRLPHQISTLEVVQSGPFRVDFFSLVCNHKKLFYFVAQSAKGQKLLTAKRKHT
ncbi:hypothetical protein RQ784_22095, partial [Roseomonas mucosa]|uniref:hypothetical protein n=1 Tax=Roseomonas mucosa TaxID=207340 RepID=UPI0028CC122A